MKHLSDNEIRSEVRSLLVRQRVDQWRLQVRVSAGMVRITGDLVFLRGSDPTPPSLVDALERALCTIPGVKRTLLEVANWRKPSGGEWQLVEERKLAAPLATAA